MQKHKPIILVDNHMTKEEHHEAKELHSKFLGMVKKKVYFYAPGSNVNVITLRKEANYDANYHGCGEITDVEVPVEKAYKAVISYDQMLRTLEFLLEDQNSTLDYETRLIIKDTIADARGI